MVLGQPINRVLPATDEFLTTHRRVLLPSRG